MIIFCLGALLVCSILSGTTTANSISYGALDRDLPKGHPGGNNGQSGEVNHYERGCETSQHCRLECK
ncbi:unnamed protein product [Thlaspi arvense]|uniref:Uncharacterized protein n=1 Tax=Thlaspi arvense TaxID=13288 RepID=A0AAU9RFL7_THLAR|nr:unnamed protein product [Thlaspi arvense]